MGTIELGKPDRLTSFANKLRKELEVETSFRGRDLRIDWESVPPRLYMPNMERAREQDFDILEGLALRLAGHCRFTSLRAVENIKDYATKHVHVAIQENLVDRLLERQWEGARDMVIKALNSSKDTLRNPAEPFRDKSWTGTVGIERVKAMMMDAGVPLDPTDERQVRVISENMEARRCANLWLDEQRGLDIIESPFLLEWNEHPWKAIFDEETSGGARNTKQALAQAERIVKRLGIQPEPLRRPVPLKKKEEVPFADFSRPVEEAKEKLKEAEAKRKEADETRRELEAKRRELAKEILRQADELPEMEAYESAREGVDDAVGEAKDAHHDLAKARKKLRDKRRPEKDAKRRLKKAARQLKEINKKIKRRQDDESLLAKARQLEERVAKREEDLSQRDGAVNEAVENVERLIMDHAATMAEREEARRKARLAREKLEAGKDEIERKVNEANEETMAPLEREARNADERARFAIAKANDLLGYVRDRDEEAEQPMGPGGTEEVVRRTFNSYKEETMDEEMGSDANADDKNAKLEDKIRQGDEPPPRKYVPYTREHDEVRDMGETSNGVKEYNETVRDMSDIIQRSNETLRRLYSPVKSEIKTNAKQGALDPRQAYKIALAARGVPIDVKRVWRDIKTKRTPKVAVSLVMDCSRSMNKVEGVNPRAALDNQQDPLIPVHEEEPSEYGIAEKECGIAMWVSRKGKNPVFRSKTIDHEGFVGRGRTPIDSLRDLQEILAEEGPTRGKIARDAVVALSEVLREANVPFEVLGHTTNTEAVPMLGLEDSEGNETFSRFAPFVGLVYKSFASREAPASVFTKVEAQDNLDGEAVLWAASRLSARRERTKILIVLSDGFPYAKYSHEGELRRHLLGACRLVESKEKEGLFLWGLGLGSDEARNYFNNCDVLKDAEELPEAVLRIVEHVLVEIKGSMA